MRHLRHTFGDLPVGATFWFTAKTRTTRGATFRREPDRAYVKVSERRYRDVDDPEGRFLYAETRLDTGVTTSPPSENRAAPAPGDVFTPTRYHKDLGEQLSPWSAGGDAIQVVASHLYAERPFPRSDLLRAAMMLEAYAREARRPGNVGRWTTKDARELSRMARHLRALHAGGAEENRARHSTGPVDLGEGIRVAFLPVNQAWAVMWHDQVLRVMPSREEALAEGLRIVARDDPKSPADAPDQVGNRAGAPPISREQYEEIVSRERAYEAAREQFDPRRFKRGGGYAPEEVAQIERLAGGPAPTNEERGLADQYRWLVDVPEHAFLYYDPAMTQVTGWMGDVRGRIVWKGAVQRKFGGGRSQAIRVEGTNGATYHGVANLTGGNYVRLRIVKAEARALKKLERFIP